MKKNFELNMDLYSARNFEAYSGSDDIVCFRRPYLIEDYHYDNKTVEAYESKVVARMTKDMLAYLLNMLLHPGTMPRTEKDEEEERKSKERWGDKLIGTIPACTMALDYTIDECEDYDDLNVICHCMEGEVHGSDGTGRRLFINPFPFRMYRVEDGLGIKDTEGHRTTGAEERALSFEIDMDKGRELLELLLPYYHNDWNPADYPYPLQPPKNNSL